MHTNTHTHTHTHTYARTHTHTYLLSSLLKFINAMEKRQFDYSYKNQPIPTERNYKLQLTEKIKLVIKGMGWKVHFYNEKKDFKENETEAIPENYGLKSLKCPPPKLKN